MDYDKYFKYKKEHIPNIQKLGKSELQQQIHSFFETVPEEFKKYVKWDIELLMLADSFMLSKNHRTGLVDACVYQDGRKIPDYENFEDERTGYYKENLNIIYSDEVLARIYNYLIEKANDGHLYVNSAIEVMYRMAKIDDASERKYLPRIIDLSIKYNKTKDALYQDLIDNIRESFIKEIDNASPFASFFLSLYEIAVFAKKDVLDSEDNIRNVIQKVKASVDEYTLVNPYGSELMLETALMISRKVKSIDLAEGVIHKSIDHRVIVGDRAFEAEDYYRAAEYYEKAAQIISGENVCNERGEN